MGGGGGLLASQIYCDFSGYSDIAIGTAHMLGFKLPENFNMPYLSENISEFWRRWHISLSTWLRDYVFISLGGSRGTELKTAVTLMTTFVLCGLWHGAKWMCVAWGAAHGAMMIAHRLFRLFCKTRPGWKAALETGWGTALRAAATYGAVSLGWVIFRAQNFSEAGGVFRALFIPQRGVMVRDPVGPWSLVFAFVVVAASLMRPRWNARLWKKCSAALTPPAWGFASYVLIYCVDLHAGDRSPTGHSFIFNSRRRRNHP